MYRRRQSPGTLRAFAKKKKFQKSEITMEVGGPGLTRNFFCEKSSQNSRKPALICWSSIPCILSVYTLLKVVGYYDLSVLSMPVMGFKKKVWMGVGGWGELSPIFLDFWNYFNFAMPPIERRSLPESPLCRFSLSQTLNCPPETCSPASNKLPTSRAVLPFN